MSDVASKDNATDEHGLVELVVPTGLKPETTSPLEPGQIIEHPSADPPVVHVTTSDINAVLANSKENLSTPASVLVNVQKLKQDILDGKRDVRSGRSTFRRGSEYDEHQNKDTDGDTVMTIPGQGDDAQSLLDSLHGILGDDSAHRPIDDLGNETTGSATLNVKRERDAEHDAYNGRNEEHERSKRARGEDVAKGSNDPRRRDSGRRSPPRNARDYSYRRSRSRSAERYNGSARSYKQSGGYRDSYSGRERERDPRDESDHRSQDRNRVASSAPAAKSEGIPALSADIADTGRAYESQNKGSGNNTGSKPMERKSSSGSRLAPEELADRTAAAEGYQSLPKKIVDRYVPEEPAPIVESPSKPHDERSQIGDTRPAYGPGSVGGPPPSNYPSLRDDDRRNVSSQGPAYGRRPIERSPVRRPPSIVGPPGPEYRGAPPRSSPTDYRGAPVDSYRSDTRDPRDFRPSMDPRGPAPGPGSSSFKPPSQMQGYPDSRSGYGHPSGGRDHGPYPHPRDYPNAPVPYGAPPSGYPPQDRYRAADARDRDYRGPPGPPPPADDRYYGGRPPVPDLPAWGNRAPYDNRGPPPPVDRYARSYDNGPPPVNYNAGPPPISAQEAEIAELKARVLEMERLAAAQKAREFEMRERERAPPPRGGANYYSGAPPPPPIDNRGYGRRDEPPASYRPPPSHEINYRPAQPPAPPPPAGSYANSIQARNAIVKDPATLRAREEGYRTGSNPSLQSAPRGGHEQGGRGGYNNNQQGRRDGPGINRGTGRDGR